MIWHTEYSILCLMPLSHQNLIFPLCFPSVLFFPSSFWQVQSLFQPTHRSRSITNKANKTAFKMMLVAWQIYTKTFPMSNWKLHIVYRFIELSQLSICFYCTHISVNRLSPITTLHIMESLLPSLGKQWLHQQDIHLRVFQQKQYIVLRFWKLPYLINILVVSFVQR